jgi:hypothetical protein
LWVRPLNSLGAALGATRARRRRTLRLNSRHRALVEGGKRSTVANVAVARELCGFVWAAMTEQPLRQEVAT